ncbi:hypothetical protein OAF34_04690 [Pirellulaceae bacterium]|nr:hypothetical protein [Pirellulaceae bacterium]
MLPLIMVRTDILGVVPRGLPTTICTEMTLSLRFALKSNKPPQKVGDKRLYQTLGD